MRLAMKIKFVDKANNRKKHIGEVPLIGGLMIVCSVFIIYFFNDSLYSDLDKIIITILYSSLIVFLIGLLDDYIDVPPYIRLVFQLIAVLIVVGNGLSITKIGNFPFSIYLNNYGHILTIFSVIVLINAYNFIDGSDGNCSSNFLFSILSILIYLYVHDKLIPSITSFLTLLTFNVLLFLIINISLFSIKKVFLGDSGSTWLGYILAWILIYLSEQNFIYPLLTLWFIALPIFDLLRLLIKRLLIKKNPFLPDRLHIHHIIAYYSKNNILILPIIFLLNIFFLFSGILITSNFSDILSLFFYILFFLFYCFFIIMLERKNR